MTFREFLNDYTKAVIVCPYKNKIVRTLDVEGEDVTIVAGEDTVKVPLDTVIVYEPWVFDRGSLIFEAPGFDESLKLCTEFDVLNFPDGTSKEVEKPA